jgi:hypothetical protein
MGTATMEKLKEGAVSEDLPAGLPMLPSLATNAQVFDEVPHII